MFFTSACFDCELTRVYDTISIRESSKFYEYRFPARLSDRITRDFTLSTTRSKVFFLFFTESNIYWYNIRKTRLALLSVIALYITYDIETCGSENSVPIIVRKITVPRNFPCFRGTNWTRDRTKTVIPKSSREGSSLNRRRVTKLRRLDKLRIYIVALSFERKSGSFCEKYRPGSRPSRQRSQLSGTPVE